MSCVLYELVLFTFLEFVLQETTVLSSFPCYFLFPFWFLRTQCFLFLRVLSASGYVDPSFRLSDICAVSGIRAVSLHMICPACPVVSFVLLSVLLPIQDTIVDLPTSIQLPSVICSNL